MRQNFKVALGLIAGTIIGAAAIESLHAQAKPPAYVVTSIENITDAQGMKGVIQKAAPEVIAKAGGRYIIRTTDITGFEGTPPQRFVVIAFDSVEKAQAWHNGEEEKEIVTLRRKFANTISFMVEGVTN